MKKDKKDRCKAILVVQIYLCYANLIEGYAKQSGVKMKNTEEVCVNNHL